MSHTVTDCSQDKITGNRTTSQTDKITIFHTKVDGAVEKKAFSVLDKVTISCPCIPPNKI